MKKSEIVKLQKKIDKIKTPKDPWCKRISNVLELIKDNSIEYSGLETDFRTKKFYVSNNSIIRKNFLIRHFLIDCGIIKEIGKFNAGFQETGLGELLVKVFPRFKNTNRKIYILDKEQADLVNICLTNQEPTLKIGKNIEGQDRLFPDDPDQSFEFYDNWQSAKLLKV